MYLLFVVTVMFFLAVYSKKLEKLVLWQAPIKSVSGIDLGNIEINKRKDGSKVLIIKLKESVAGETIVLIQLKGHIGLEVGRFNGASFIVTIPNRIKVDEITNVQLISANNGRVLAEVLVNLNRKSK